MIDVVPGDIYRQIFGNVGELLGSFVVGFRQTAGFVFAVGKRGRVVGAMVVLGGFLLFVGVREVVLVFRQLQHRVALDGFPHFQVQFQRRKLHQLDGLLDLRRDGQMLPQPRRKRLLHS